MVNEQEVNRLSVRHMLTPKFLCAGAPGKLTIPKKKIIKIS